MPVKWDELRRKVANIQPKLPSGASTITVNDLSLIHISPTEDYLLFTMTQEGPKERKEIYEVLAYHLLVLGCG